MVVDIDEAQCLLLVVLNQFLNCCDFWDQFSAHFQLGGFAVFLVVLKVESVEVFSDQTCSIITTQNSVNINHGHDFER